MANQLLSAAWFVNAFERTKRLPTLRSVLDNKIDPPTEEDLDEARSLYDDLTEALDGA